MISEFQDEYRFLSNFWHAEVEYDGEVYPTNEHAFQAAKTNNKAEREEIRTAPTAGRAKRLGKKVTLRGDWGKAKFEVMYQLSLSKFSEHPQLKKQLLATGHAWLVEGNKWHDNIWGICSCDRCGRTTFTNFNNLGKILMKVRAELRDG